MNIKIYEEMVRETAMFPKEPSELGKAYCALGLVEEYKEYINATLKEDKIKELGDILWYVTACAHQWGFTLSELIEYEALNCYASDFFNVNYMLADIAGKTKKHIRDKKDYKNEIFNILCNMISYLKKASFPYGNLIVIMEKNQEKLLDRKKRNVISGEGDNR